MKSVFRVFRKVSPDDDRDFKLCSREQNLYPDNDHPRCVTKWGWDKECYYCPSYNDGSYERALNGDKTVTRVVIPYGVTHIGPGAFMTCKSLTKVIIPNSVTHIGPAAFSHCESLTEVTIPTRVTHIGKGAFEKSTSLIRNNKRIKKNAFIVRQ